MEFALVLPVVLFLLLGVVETAVVARSELQLIQAAREGARQAAVTTDMARAVAAVRASLGPLASRARISVSRPSGIGERATVRVRVPHRIAAPLFGGFTVELDASATMRTER